MQIDAKNLGTDQLRLRLDGVDGQSNTLVLGRSTGVTGSYGQDEQAFAFDGLAAALLRIAELSWALPFGRLTTEGECLVEALDIDARINRQVPAGQPSFEGALAASTWRIPRAVLAREGLVLQLDGVIINGLQVNIRGNGTFVTIAGLQAERVQLRTPDLEAEVDGFELPQGLEIQGDQISLPELTIAQAAIELPQLTTSKDEPVSKDELARNDAGESAAPPVEAWRFLDQLAGKFHVDLKVDATVPVLGRRQATHRFRIPIRQGALNFRELERDLSSLEDAVLDFRVRGNQLRLERDLSMLGVLAKTLVFWELTEADEIHLAKEDRRVRLRRLATPQVPEPRKREEVEEGKQGVVVRQLDFDNLDVSLRLGAGSITLPSGARIRLGSETHAACEALEVGGDVRYEPGRSVDPTEVEISAHAIHLGIDELPTAGRTMSVSTVAVDTISEVSIQLDGVRPTSVSASVRGIGVREVTLSSGGPPPP